MYKELPIFFKVLSQLPFHIISITSLEKCEVKLDFRSPISGNNFLVSKELRQH